MKKNENVRSPWGDFFDSHCTSLQRCLRQKLITFQVFESKFHPEILRDSPRAGALNGGGVDKIGDFRTLSRHISDTVQDRTKVVIDH